jgi:hypothetical protein
LSGKLEWNGDRAKAAIRAELARRLNRAAILVLNHWKDLINTDGTGVRAKSGGGRDKQGRFRKKKGGLAYGANPSAPGEPPHKQRGRLLASAAWEVVGLVARVGTNLLYGRWLELGTSRMAARPSLRRALKEMQGEVLAILRAPMNLK